MSKDLQNLIAKRFIARTDVKAVQIANGQYRPVNEPWGRTDLERHLAKEATYGHYMLNGDNQCKLIAFDVDIEKRDEERKKFVGWVPASPDFEDFYEADTRSIWHDRSKVNERAWLKMELRTAAHDILKSAMDLLDVPCAVAYSGDKGIHVYAFTGLISAASAREGAEIVMSSTAGFARRKQTNFYEGSSLSAGAMFANLSVEIYPKQSTVDTDGYGNLMRLPLGRNLKSKDPTFFMDMTSPMGEMRPLDSMYALSDGYSPWRRLSD